MSNLKTLIGMDKRVALYLVGGILVGYLGGIGVTGLLKPPVLATTVVSATSTVPGRVLGQGQSAPVGTASDVDFKQFWDIWQMLKSKYYQQPVQDQTLFYGALNGLAGSLGDPYTTYFEPTSAQDFRTALSGKFEGIGAEIGIKDDQMQVVAPLPDTPASRAGLLAGDMIVKIDGAETAGMTTEKAVTLIRGPKGTSVTLTIFRMSQKKAPYDVTIIRDAIQIKSVTEKILPGGIALITVTHFNEDTQSAFSGVVDKIRKDKNVKGIILDMRNNPGGFLDTALSMAGAWVGDGIVVKERKQGKIVDELHGIGPAFLAGIPTIVLVNQGSASAAEIVAGALQDQMKSTIIGEKTFGKGSVQDYQDLKDGSAIKITIAEWVTPNERTINKEGLSPDIVVDRTPEDYVAAKDPQLDRAIGIFNGTEPSSAGAATGTQEAAPSSTRQ